MLSVGVREINSYSYSTVLPCISSALFRFTTELASVQEPQIHSGALTALGYRKPTKLRLDQPVRFFKFDRSSTAANFEKSFPKRSGPSLRKLHRTSV